MPAPVDRLAGVILRGRTLTADLREAVTSATLSLGTEEVSELTLTLIDEGLKLASSGLIVTDTSVDLDDLRLLIAAVALGPGPAGTGELVLDCRPRTVDRLKRRRGPLVMRKVSPSTFVTVEAKAAGYKSVIAEPTATRAQVSRDVPAKGETYGDDPPSSWTTFARLRDELGFLLFDVAETLYFGRPTWLVGKLTAIRVGWLGEPDATRAQALPEMRRSKDARNLVEGTLLLPYERLAEARPGRAVNLYGVPGYAGKYLITKVDAELAAVDEPITVSIASPLNPTPNPPETTTAASNSTPAGKTPTASAFVTVALSQVGDVYRLGAEASITDDDPTAFDCSELVQWALGRVGVTFVDGSAAQVAKLKPVTVAVGLATRGALLYTPGHIAISLGDGRVVEAANAKSGVTLNGAGRRFTSAGLIPGLTY